MQSCPCFLFRWSLTTTHPGCPDHAHLRVSCKDGCSWACRSLTTTHPVCPDHAFLMVVVQGWSFLTSPRGRLRLAQWGVRILGLTLTHSSTHHNKLAGFIQRLSIITLNPKKKHLSSIYGGALPIFPFWPFPSPLPLLVTVELCSFSLFHPSSPILRRSPAQFSFSIPSFLSL